MPRPDLSKIPVFYHNYIQQVEGTDLMGAMKKQTNSIFNFLKSVPVEKRNFRYAKGKWTIKEMLQHIIDTERIFAYRGLCIARKETVSLPGFDENNYANNSKAKKREWNDMIEELKAVRRSSEIMYASFDREQMTTFGLSNNNPISVAAIGFIIVGHINHHIKVIKEKYLN